MASTSKGSEALWRRGVRWVQGLLERLERSPWLGSAWLVSVPLDPRNASDALPNLSTAGAKRGRRA